METLKWTMLGAIDGYVWSADRAAQSMDMRERSIHLITFMN